MQQISPQERAIMQVVWDAKEAYPTTRDIEAALRSIDGIERSPSSVLTVIARLVDKGFLNPVKIFRKSIYFEPLITEDEYKIYVTKQFIDGVHRGKFSSLVSSFLEGDDYKQNDINELRELLNGMDA